MTINAAFLSISSLPSSASGEGEALFLEGRGDASGEGSLGGLREEDEEEELLDFGRLRGELFGDCIEGGLLGTGGRGGLFGAGALGALSRGVLLLLFFASPSLSPELEDEDDSWPGLSLPGPCLPNAKATSLGASAFSNDGTRSSAPLSDPLLSLEVSSSLSLTFFVLPCFATASAIMRSFSSPSTRAHSKNAVTSSKRLPLLRNSKPASDMSDLSISLVNRCA